MRMEAGAGPSVEDICFYIIISTPDFGSNSTARHERDLSVLRKETDNNQVKPQPAGYLSWESISYFFGRWTTNDFPARPTVGKVLEETRVDLNVTTSERKIKKIPLVNQHRTREMEKTMEYTVTLYDTLPKIALKFDVTPSELSRLNRLTIRTLYPGQVLRVPCPQATDNSCAGCSDAIMLGPSPPKSMSMNHHQTNKTPVVKRVSFDDIDEDVLETFIKIKSKYITDGQGVVKGFLLITPHAVIFHPDVSEILVVDRGAEYYQVHFPMQSVCAAGMFDDIAQMAVHDSLHPGHFFLDKPLMSLLDYSNTVCSKEGPKEENSSGTLHPSMSFSREKTVESLGETTADVTVDCDDPPRTVTSSETESIKDILKDMIEQVDRKTSEIPLERSMVSGTNTESHSEDVVVSSSSHSSVTCDENHPLPTDTEQLVHVTSTGHAHQMNSTPKRGFYKEPGDDRQIKTSDRVNEGHSYSEGISKDSGIDEHFSRENVPSDSTADDHHVDSKSWMENFEANQQHALEPKEIIPTESTCHVDMPKYLCVKIKKACWPELRPRLCRHAHEAIQRATDERREFWFSIPSDRLFDVYGFFLEWCPAIHDGESDEENLNADDADFVGSCGSDYSVITMSEIEEEDIKIIDNVFSKSPDNEKRQSSRKRLHSREKKKKKKPEQKEPERKTSSWSNCSVGEQLLPEIVGKSEILTESHILQLSERLPSRTIGHDWRLIYSTYLHGISLKTLYRTLAEYDTPALLVILDESRKVFGAFASSPFAVSEHFYGTGECFLYSFSPDLKVYRWSGENNFFIKGDVDSLAFGGGEGNFGLWLDGDLYHGSSHRCKTYKNEPLTVTEDFLCCGVEIWCFE